MFKYKCQRSLVKVTALDTGRQLHSTVEMLCSAVQWIDIDEQLDKNCSQPAARVVAQRRAGKRKNRPVIRSSRRGLQVEPAGGRVRWRNTK
jgi:hypothetical protein